MNDCNCKTAGYSEGDNGTMPGLLVCCLICGSLTFLLLAVRQTTRSARGVPKREDGLERGSLRSPVLLSPSRLPGVGATT